MIIYPEEIMTAKIKTLEAELDKYKQAYEASMRIVKSAFPENFPDNYFISGESGEKDDNGLPKQIHVCPAYGCDWFMLYERRDVTWGTEY